ncbi:response regulator receiver modulated metal dependent phosphohydrolase [Desulfonatronospira thiodismutans ASO3-1]|uniref:Response regulator receiver modulated metal dependent phosphohydrolase n=1 Tax=Desulfonatronospira thiodismutans ASO3-1 TaxID=555779 RepID=D6SSR1_9BACT|nr:MULTISPECIES: HD domain-containing phosphohydrolase [Desulfonatronospira]EFI33727.1 response regulator receiver modulated metal dependent phosphohydrolase [Desulfonatronospira thiodismutans ASO3-1]
MKVLVVEDDKISRKTLSLYARNTGYEPIAAADGKEALKLWHEHRPRIILTDWNMPVMDGLELISRVRASEGDEYTYIIMITSRDDSTDLIRGFESGVDDYLTKPVDKSELLVRLKASERIFSLQSKDTVIFAMAKLAETRDPETGLHLERIQSYCRIVSEFLLRNSMYQDIVNRRFIDDIYSTSPLHDIGKVGIPDHILLKPGRLDEEEFEIMKTHTTIGYDTLKSTIQQNPKANYLRMSADIARYHHEKWNGSGYPDGLAGEDIPLASRILAVADVYDALASKRVYKDAFSHEKTRAIIRDGKGSHFDPTLVDVFLECEDEFIETLERFREV